VRPGSAPLLLTDLEQKVELLEETGVDEVAVLTFDEERAAEPAEEFVHELLLGRLGARAVVVGSNFRFGHRHRGDVELLAKLGGELGFEVRALELVADDDARTAVSSSRIRALVEAGELEHASRLLGRPHQLRATVVGGAPQPAASPSGSLPGDRPAAVLRTGMCQPPQGWYEGLIGPLGHPGAATRLLLAGAEVSSPALEDQSPGTTVLVQFLEASSPRGR
jgi:riboflavin kinase/FMN adenylyltransferase